MIKQCEQRNQETAPKSERQCEVNKKVLTSGLQDLKVCVCLSAHVRRYAIDVFRIIMVERQDMTKMVYTITEGEDVTTTRFLNKKFLHPGTTQISA